MRKVIYSLLLFVVASCANRVTPTGGEKDIEPPKVLDQLPANGSVRFESKEIHLAFDENIALSDLQGQFIVSPLMSKLPEVKAAKKEITIILPNDLAPNTTYTLNFGKAIVDVHEANALENFQYVFSTGDYLDSLKVEGRVVDALTGERSKSITLMGYQQKNHLLSDSLVFKKRPDYFAKTNERGEFKISNMAAGSYYLFAVDDKNNNYLCDSSGEESMAFLDSALLLPGDFQPELRLSPIEPEKSRFRKAIRLDRYAAMISFNKRIDSLLLKNLDGKNWNGNYYPTANRDTFYFYLPDTISDSLSLLMFNGSEIIDTLLLSMLPPEGIKGVVNRLRINVKASPAFFGPSSPMIISSNHPLQAKLDSATVTEDSSKSIRLPLKMMDPVTGYFKIEYPWQQGKRYKVTLLPGAVKDIYSLTTDTTSYDILVPTEENTAMLSIKMQNLKPGKKYLLQLVSEKFEGIRELEIDRDSVYTFSYLTAGPVKLRLIEDSNRDHCWTYTKYATRRQPEMVWMYPETITLRANWELEVVFVVPK